MKEIVLYLNESEAKAHGKIEAVVNLLRVHRLTAKSDRPTETEVEAEKTDEVFYDTVLREDEVGVRELAEDEAVEVEKTYYMVIL
jgi:hypothetical protein